MRRAGVALFDLASTRRSQLAGAGSSNAPQRLLHGQNTWNSCKALGLRDVRFCGGSPVRTARRDHDRRLGHSSYLILAGSPIIPSLVAAHIQRRSRSSRNLGSDACLLLLHWDSTAVCRPELDRGLLPWLLLLATVYFLLNSWLVAIVVGLHKRRSPLSVWRQSFLWLSLNYYSGASVAALILPYLVQAGDSAFMYVAGVILPVLIISYLTFKTALGRIEDANTHLSQLNRLYLSTIETLAMAIDAKDQITHGHIRRVQQYAVGLASISELADRHRSAPSRRLRFCMTWESSPFQRYILNKPGKLTPAEFERMKLHASIGADILSAIDFPVPRCTDRATPSRELGRNGLSRWPPQHCDPHWRPDPFSRRLL